MKVEFRAILPTPWLPGVFDQRECQIKGDILLDLRSEVAHIPANGIDGWRITGWILDGDLQMTPLVTDGARRSNRDYVT